MRIVITSGGTSENIDAVRAITNKSTGKLGSLIADAFIRACPDVSISYICSDGAVLPSSSCAEIIKVGSVKSLHQSLTTILTSQTVDAVIHAMAVSDYQAIGLTTAEMLASAIADKVIAEQTSEHNSNYLTDIILQTIIANNAGLDSSIKMKSTFDNLIISMTRTPKVISIIKKLQPTTVLVGFKLLTGVSEQDLITAGHKLLLTNNCDFVLANDMTHIHGSSHIGFFINRDATYTKLETKEEIAEVIVTEVNRLAQ